jgi:hypothetical protein
VRRGVSRALRGWRSRVRYGVFSLQVACCWVALVIRWAAGVARDVAKMKRMLARVPGVFWILLSAGESMVSSLLPSEHVIIGRGPTIFSCSIGRGLLQQRQLVKASAGQVLCEYEYRLYRDRQGGMGVWIVVFYPILLNIGRESELFFAPEQLPFLTAILSNGTRWPRAGAPLRKRQMDSTALLYDDPCS